MKKRMLSALLALCLCLGLLPAAALAAGNSYGPDADGYGYTVSETDFALGTVEHDGTGLTREDVFSLTVTNTGEKPIEIMSTYFGRWEISFDAGDNISLDPGESKTLHYTMKIEAGAPDRNDWAQGGLPVMLGDTLDYTFTIYVTFNTVNTSLTPEPTPTPTPEPTPTPTSTPSGGGNSSGYVDENGNYWGSDNMGNRYHGVQVGGNYGGNTFVSGGSGGSTKNLGENLSSREGESYGFTVSPHSLSFDSCFVGEEVKPQYVTLTNTGSTALDDIYSGFFVDKNENSHYSVVSMKVVEGKLNSDGELDPGQSLTYEVRLNPWKEGSGPISYEGQFCLYSHAVVSVDSHGWGVSKGGHYGKIPGVLTVDYDIRPLTEVKKGDIDWTVSTKSIDFGTSDVRWASGGHKAQEKTFTVTNRGSLAFLLEEEIDTDRCLREDAKYIFNAYISGSNEVKPGESVTLTVRADRSSADPGAVEGCVLKLTAYYPDSKEKNTITAEIPLSIKYLYDGGYRIKNMSDNSYGTVKTSDGVKRDPYSGNEWFTAKEGSDVTFVMTPYDPAAYHVSDIKLNGKSMGIGGLVNNTYTISNIRDNYEFEAVFGPGADPNGKPAAQQPTAGNPQPAAWAKAFVEQAVAEGLLPAELQSAYDQPITRREFCLLADALYTKVKGAASLDASITFTDTTDPAVLRMASAKVVNGVGGGAFNPDGQLTRQEAATMLARLSAVLGKPLAAGEPTFGDNDAIAGWARPFVGQMQASGVMSGTGNNQFSPRLIYSREQSIVTLMRLYALVK